jgi:hypothetical protein
MMENPGPDFFSSAANTKPDLDYAGQELRTLVADAAKKAVAAIIAMETGGIPTQEILVRSLTLAVASTLEATLQGASAAEETLERTGKLLRFNYFLLSERTKHAD